MNKVYFTLIIILSSIYSLQAQSNNAPKVPDQAIERLAESVRYQTISYYDTSRVNYAIYEDFINFLEKTYPLAHQTLKREIINDYTLLYEWEGSDATLKPALLMAHYDVVPVEEKNLPQWEQPPFKGVVDEQFIWGRGSIDNKATIMGLLETAELLIQAGHQPKRSIYFSFGHDEEVGGPNGAAKVAELFKERGVYLGMILDEGGAISKGVIPGVDKAIAMIGTAEKGHVNVILTAHQDGGHSSAPPKQTAINILSAALYKLERNPMPTRLQSPTKDMFKNLSSEFPFPLRLVARNLWLFGGVVRKQLSKENITNATVRTVMSPTIIRAGNKENILPKSASVNINVRILQGDSVEEVVQHIKKTIDDDRIEITLKEPNKNPSKISPLNSAQFELLKRIIEQEHEDIIVTPILTIAGTDTHHFDELSDHVFRFQPIIGDEEDLKRVHGVNERISKENYRKSIVFFYYFLEGLSEAGF